MADTEPTTPEDLPPTDLELALEAAEQAFRHVGDDARLHGGVISVQHIMEMRQALSAMRETIAAQDGRYTVRLHNLHFEVAFPEGNKHPEIEFAHSHGHLTIADSFENMMVFLLMLRERVYERWVTELHSRPEYVQAASLMNAAVKEGNLNLAMEHLATMRDISDDANKYWAPTPFEIDRDELLAGYNEQGPSES